MNTGRIIVESFGFLFGMDEADMVMDVRGLQNPFYVPQLRELTGLDAPVRDYIFSFPESVAYFEAMMELLRQRCKLLEHQHTQMRHALKIAIGCSGGQHRSVAFAEAVGQELCKLGYDVAVEHRELHKRTEL